MIARSYFIRYETHKVSSWRVVTHRSWFALPLSEIIKKVVPEHENVLVTEIKRV